MKCVHFPSTKAHPKVLAQLAVSIVAQYGVKVTGGGAVVFAQDPAVVAVFSVQVHPNDLQSIEDLNYVQSSH